VADDLSQRHQFSEFINLSSKIMFKLENKKKEIEQKSVSLTLL